MLKSLTSMIVATAVAAGMLVAQDPPSRAGRISYVSGTVSFQPAGVTDWAPATVNRPLTIGDQLFVDQGGKAEVHVPGTAFRMGDSTAFQFLNLDDRKVQVRLSEGSLDVRIRNLYGGIEIDGPNASFTPSAAGEYRIDTNPDTGQTYITVRDGQGQVTGSSGSFTIMRANKPRSWDRINRPNTTFTARRVLTASITGSGLVASAMTATPLRVMSRHRWLATKT